MARLLGPTVRAFVTKLEKSRPPVVSPELKARILDMLPEEGEVTRLNAPDRAKLASLEAVLRVHQRESVYTIKVIDILQAGVALHARTVVLISKHTLRLLESRELQAQVAHEIGHEYVWEEYQTALEHGNVRRLQELELFCDGVAITTLRMARLDPTTLRPGLEKIARFNARRLGVARNESHYPSLAERSQFIDAVVAWIARTG